MSHSLLEGKPFFCRQWAFTKIAQCLQHKQSKLGGALVVGGVGSGKTALCCELVRPTAATGRQLSLHARLLAHHFCRADDTASLQMSGFILGLVERLVRSGLLPGYAEKLRDPEIGEVLTPVFCDRQPDEALQRAVLFPLLELDEPPQPLLLVVDAVDDAHRVPGGGGRRSGSRSLAELLAGHQHLLPRWLLLVVTARRHSKEVTRLFAGFRKIVLDDLRKANVVTDLQQYILSRLEREAALRQHLSNETAEMLNQLHIKSNGCLLYLEKVLNGVAEGFILLREVREIPGTLNGLYLWLSQRLFTKKHFHKALPVLNVLVAAFRPVSVRTLFECVRLKHSAVTRDDFERRLAVLARLTVDGPDGAKLLFHHSYAEWLTDVKYCTQRFLCQRDVGHGMLAAWLLRRARQLAPDEVQRLAAHLVRMRAEPAPRPGQLALLLLWSGAEVETCLQDGEPDDPAALQLLREAGAETVPLRSAAGSRQASVEPEPRPEPGSELRPEPGSEPEPRTGAVPRLEPGAEAEPELEPELEQELEPEPGPELEEEPELDPELESDSDRRLLQMYLSEGEPADRLAEQALLLSAAQQGDVGLLELLLRRRVPCEAADAAGQTPLTLAARQGHADAVAALLAAGAAPDRPDGDGWTPLRSAAWAGHTPTVQLLLAAGAAVDSVDAEQRTALRAAAWAGHDDIVSALLAAGADVNGTDREGRTALIAAAYMGHVEIVQRLLDGGADIDHADSDGRTALSVAALCVPTCEGAGRVVALLLERGADVNHEDKEGMSPLLVAAFEGHRDVCELLLEADADVDHTDAAGRCALFAAASMGHHQVVQLLLFWGCYCDSIDPEGRTVLSVAAAQGCLQTVRLLLDRGLDEGHRDNGGWTPLHYAAYEGQADVLDALLDAGAKVNELDNDGKHALILAAQEGHVSAVAALVERGADVNLRSHDGKTSLRMAALERHKDVVHYLICNGADPSYRDMDGRSTLYLLALDNRTSMAAFLLDSGADVESRDLEGRTALHVSAWQGHLETVRLLLQRGADPDAVDAERRTPLIGAAWQGRPAVVRALLAHGATVDHTCSQGATALCIAAQEGHLECVRVLLDHFADPNHSDVHGRSALKVALKGRHEAVVRLLEEYGATGAAPPPLPPQPPPPLPPCPASNSSTSMNSASTAETKPSSAVLVSSSPAGSASSTFEKRQSCVSLCNNSNSKSSSNLTSSTGKSSQTSQPGLDASPSPSAGAQPGSLSFTQQLQQCRRRGRPAADAGSPPRSPAAERRSAPTSPLGAHLPLIYADPLDSRPAPAPPAAAARPAGGRQRASGQFTFNQNEHMRIILGSKAAASEGRPRRGLVASANSGLKAGLGLRARAAAPGKQLSAALGADASNGFHLRRETPL